MSMENPKKRLKRSALSQPGISMSYKSKSRKNAMQIKKKSSLQRSLKK